MTKLPGAPTTMNSTMKLAVLAAGMMMTSMAAQATTITFNGTPVTGSGTTRRSEGNRCPICANAPAHTQRLSARTTRR